MVRTRSLTLSRKPARPKQDAFASLKRFALRALVLLFLALGVVGAVVYRRGGEQIRDTANKIFQNQFPGVKTSFRSVTLDGDRGVRLLGVEWRSHNDSDKSPALLSAEEIYVVCPIKLSSALQNDFQPRKIVVRHPCLRLNAYERNYIGELSSLLPNTGASSPCEIEIVDASVSFLDSKKSETHKISGIDVNLRPQALEDPQEEPTNDLENEIDDEASDLAVNVPQTPRVQIKRQQTRSAEYTAYNSQVRIRPIDYEEPLEQIEQPSPSSDINAWTLEASVSNPFVESLKLSGNIDSLSWSFKGAVNKLDLSALHDLLADLVDLPDSFFNDLQGKTSLDLDVSGNFESFDSVRYKVVGSALNCALTSPILKYPVSEIETRYLIENESASLEKFTAHCGLTLIKGAYRQRGLLFSPTSSTLQMKLNDFPLDDTLLKNLVADAARTGATSSEQAESLAKFLEDYSFKATTNIATTIEKSPRTNSQWAPANLEIVGKNVEFTYGRFPYHVDQLIGKVTLDAEQTLTLALRSAESKTAFTVNGRFENILTAPRGQVDVVAKNRSIDAALLNALPTTSQPTLKSLHPSGNLDVDLRVIYDPVVYPQDPLQIETGLNVRDGFVQYDLFPLPISSIEGSIFMRNGAWVFNDLTGKTASGTLVASGSLVSGTQLEELMEEFRAKNANEPTTLQGVEFEDGASSETLSSPAPLALFSVVPIPNDPLSKDAVRFQLTTDVNSFPLGEELRKALVKYEKKEEFEQLNLDGKADGQIRISYRTDVPKLGLEFDMTPTPGMVSARPEKLPFELREIDGRFVYREGSLTIDGFRAQNGRATLSANIKSRTIPNRGWSLDVSNLRVDQLQIDRDIQSATPNQATKFLSFLNPSGCFNIDGAMRLSKGAGEQAKTRVSWDLRVILQQNSARPFVQLDAICGSAKLVGAAVEDGPSQVFAFVDLDSLYYNDLQIAGLSGPIYYNGVDVFWGREAPTIRRTQLYQDPFLRGRIDLAPVFQPSRGASPVNDLGPGTGDVPKTARAPLFRFRGQAPVDSPAGFNNAATSSDVVASTALAPTADGRSSLHARLFEGALVSDGVFNIRETPTYRFTTALHNGKLEDFSRYFAPGSKPLKGRVNAHASLQGEGYSVATLKGEGDMNIQEAELYELPQIVKIFQLLSVQEPDQSAFNSATVKFNVLGDRLKLTNVLLRGEALTLFGDGWVTLRGQENLIDLTLNSRLGNASNRIPIVSDVLGEMGDQLTQIRVEGNLKSPIVHQEAAPGVKKAWWSFFPEGEPEPTDKAPVEKTRPIRDAWKKLTGTKKE